MIKYSLEKTGFSKLFKTLYFFFLASAIISTGNKTRLVSVPVTNVSDVSQPNAFVPPKSLKQKITNPATSTSEV
jgi:hypothetical protein